MYGTDQAKITENAITGTRGNYANLLGMLNADKTGSMAGWQRRQGEVLGGYGDRLSTAMGMAEGLGEQAKKDVLTQYGASGASQQANLQNRGLGGTTIASGVAQSNMRQQADSMNRLADQLSREKIGLYTGLTGEQLAAQERLTGQTQSMADQWANTITGTTNERNLAGLNLSLQGQETQADLRRAGTTDYTTNQLNQLQSYGGQQRALDMSFPQMWGNFVTQNPLEFPNFSSLNQFGGILTASDQAIQQAKAAKAAQKPSMFGGLMGGGTGALAGGLMGSLLTPMGLLGPTALLPMLAGAGIGGAYGFSSGYR
jgi:hypothetical protein